MKEFYNILKSPSIIEITNESLITSFQDNNYNHEMYTDGMMAVNCELSDKEASFLMGMG